jgi:DNA-directed RNA polymerase subunit RPC12/RpoP
MSRRAMMLGVGPRSGSAGVLPESPWGWDRPEMSSLPGTPCARRGSSKQDSNEAKGVTMAVIACKNCGTKVNSEAVACPACGADPRTGEGGTPSSAPSSDA